MQRTFAAVFFQNGATRNPGAPLRVQNGATRYPGVWFRFQNGATRYPGVSFRVQNEAIRYPGVTVQCSKWVLQTPGSNRSVFRMGTSDTREQPLCLQNGSGRLCHAAQLFSNQGHYSIIMYELITSTKEQVCPRHIFSA